jgi:hypothetical protein
MRQMPVDSTHLDYDANAAVWLRARDVFAGEDAVKQAGERYLPRLDSQSDEEYKAYRARASFFNATARTADGFVGLIFRREPTFKIPEGNSGVARAMAEFADDADMLGTAMGAYAKNVANEVIGVGRAGTLIDWEGEVEQRAYAVLYQAEQIINWRSERVNGRNVLTLLVLRETAKTTPDQNDPFVADDTEQLRVLRLVESSELRLESSHRKWTCVVEIWRREKMANGIRRHGVLARQESQMAKKAKWVKTETRIPKRLGKSLPFIPFVFHGPRHSRPEIDKLPLADIITVNLDHYRLDADYKHGLHFTALPTAWVSGFDKTATLRIGASTAWVTETVGATAGFLEFTGDGLSTFERAMDRDERLMAVLGTRMLEAQKRVGETAETIQLRQSGETSVLNTISLSFSESLTQILQWVYWWNSTEETPEAITETQVLAQLNTDFSDKGLESQELTAIVAAWQAGAISRESMFELFRKGEVLPAGRSNEEEMKLLKDGHKEAQRAQETNGSKTNPARTE